tara:strand:+ start:50 stop:442 length:393 start_codon:yes stop_codon:yes gene_type:complete
MRIILLCALFLGTLGTVLYQVKTGIDIREDRLATLESEITKAKREIAVLEAEWAYLSRPERVMELSNRLLGMRPIAKNRVLPIDAIPMRLVPKFEDRVVGPGQMKPAVGDSIAPEVNLFRGISRLGAVQP